MKKLLAVILSLSCILGCFCGAKNGDKFVYRADENDEFEANEDYYWQLCTTRGLDEATTRMCARFRAYEDSKRQSIEGNIRDLNNQIADIKANIMSQGQRLNDINNTIASVEKQIKGIEIEIKTIEENIDDITNQIIEREQKIEELNDGIKTRMVALQSTMSLNTYISFIMGANSFVDLLRRVNAINQFTSYDVSKIRIPYFMAAGTGETDDKGVPDITREYAGVAPLASLIENYEAISDDTFKVRARATGAEHEEMLARSDGYMTAWMLYQLQGDNEAAAVFIGEDAEILHNNNWQDVEKNK